MAVAAVSVLLAVLCSPPVGRAASIGLAVPEPAPRQGVSAAGVATTVLATYLLDAAPADRRWVLRRSHPLNEDAHAHAPGFIYAAVGSSYLVVEDTQGSLMAEGMAAWAPPIGHLHTAPYRASSASQTNDPAGLEVWTILLERDVDLRQPGAAAVSPPPRRLPPGPYEARLSLVTLEPGATTGLIQRTGPELAYTLSGTWELEYLGVPFAFGALQGYAADPGIPHKLRNVGTIPGRQLSAQLMPAGQPAALPAATRN